MKKNFRISFFKNKLNLLQKRYKNNVNVSLNDEIKIDNKVYKTDSYTNVNQYILSHISRKLYLNQNNPIGILSNLIEKRFNNKEFTVYKNFSPVVSTFENFDILGVKPDHPSRSRSDTYYVNCENLLRTHTSAHEYHCFKRCKTPGFIMYADVYRKDDIDNEHYPVFHQVEGTRLWSQNDPNFIINVKKQISDLNTDLLLIEDPQADIPWSSSNPKQSSMSEDETYFVSLHLKKTLENLVSQLYVLKLKTAGLFHNKNVLKIRWVPSYFSWTSPSWEMEIFSNGSWIECCGCGLIEKSVLSNFGIHDKFGWAFGIGLDRLAMILFDIPDIRFFWSQNLLFSSQFQSGKISSFVPFSKFLSIKRDLSFWLQKNSSLNPNEVINLLKSSSCNLIKHAYLLDKYIHTNLKVSHSYRLIFHSNEKNLTNCEVNLNMSRIEKLLVKNFNVEIR